VERSKEVWTSAVNNGHPGQSSTLICVGVKVHIIHYSWNNQSINVDETASKMRISQDTMQEYFRVK
jgi:hypothetical protein